MKIHGLLAAGAMLLAGTVHAQSLKGDALVKALQKGGYVIVMRHANSPREVPDKKTANPDNTETGAPVGRRGPHDCDGHGQSSAQLEDSDR